MTPHEFTERLSRAWPEPAGTRHRTVVAVSGGADSVALLRGLCQLLAGQGGDPKQLLVVAHFNHLLRGEESDRDQQFVGDLATQLGLKCAIGQDQAPAENPSRSEDSLRRRRYVFLEVTARHWGARYVATGHTRDDQSETVLFRLLRGTSISGLRGMATTRPLCDDVSLIRPLLWARRSDIESYLRSLGQLWRDDRSNQQLDYSRNRIRHEILPLLTQLHPRVVDNLVGIAEAANEYQQTIDGIVASLLRHLTIDRQPQHVRIDLRPLADAPELIVREALKQVWAGQRWPLGEMNRGHWVLLARLALAPYDELRETHQTAQTFPGNIRVERIDSSTLELMTSSPANGDRQS